MRPKFWVAGWMLLVLGLVACDRGAPVAPAAETTPAVPAPTPAAVRDIRIEKKTEVVKEESGDEAVIHAPVFHGIADPAVLKRLQETIDAGVRDVTSHSPEEWKASGEDWLSEIDYEVTYNRHDLLSLAYVVAGMGAYPDEMHAYVVADLKTGRRLTAKDLFKSHQELAAKVDRMRAAAIETAIQEFRPYLEGNQMTEEDLLSTMEPAREKRFGVENLDTFRLDDKGVTFVFDFEFPHVSQALEPSGEYFLSYEELRPYINPEGPLAHVL